MIPLTLVLRKLKIAKIGKGQVKLNHLVFMDDLKLYAKNEKQMESLIHTVRICSWNLGLKMCCFGDEEVNLLEVRVQLCPWVKE